MNDWYNRELARYRGDYDLFDPVDAVRRRKIKEDCEDYEKYLAKKNKMSDKKDTNKEEVNDGKQ